MANLPKIALGAWAWGNDGTFGTNLTENDFHNLFDNEDGVALIIKFVVYHTAHPYIVVFYGQEADGGNVDFSMVFDGEEAEVFEPEGVDDPSPYYHSLPPVPLGMLGDGGNRRAARRQYAR